MYSSEQRKRLSGSFWLSCMEERTACSCSAPVTTRSYVNADRQFQSQMPLISASAPKLGDLGCFYGSGFGMWELQSAYPTC